MPELPEVETIRRDLDREVVGREIAAVTVSGTRSLRWHTGGSLGSRLEGQRVGLVQRRGKYLLCRLDDGDVLVIHLGMSGQLLLAPDPSQPAERHTHVTISFADGPELRFVDPRTFGAVLVATADGLDDAVPGLRRLGFDPVEEPVGPARFAALLRARRLRLKPLLMDQRLVAGIGNIYSDEILYAARLRWDRAPVSLTPAEVRRLHRAMVTTLHRAIQLRGSSLADRQYRDLFGRLGQFQAEHQVYAREGKACRRCLTPIARVKVAGRSSFLCPRCQR
ncbi:MAG: bifunctional DNA-formamidopyrimidine glycosylase/DNA-(apurinic or apyrimidinic site) lyase [Acidimicrobiales bacterium]